MRCFRSLGSCAIMAVASLGCRMDNPAFGLTDEFAGESSESGLDGTGASESSSDAETSSGAETSTTTEPLDTGSSTDGVTSDTETSTSENTSENTTETDGGLACEGGLVDCGGAACVDLETDPNNCGDCGSVCGESEMCIGTCTSARYIFVSSTVTTGNMGGIAEAGFLCQELAQAAGLPGAFYLTWNSTIADYPNANFVQDDSVYRRTDGHVVATSYEDLTDGSLALPINLDEHGLPPPNAGALECPNLMGGVWSGTTALGEFGGIPNCSNWTSSLLILGKVGSFLSFDSKWSEYGDCAITCNHELPIYCVQQSP